MVVVCVYVCNIASLSGKELNIGYSDYAIGIKRGKICGDKILKIFRVLLCKHSLWLEGV